MYHTRNIDHDGSSNTVLGRTKSTDKTNSYRCPINRHRIHLLITKVYPEEHKLGLDRTIGSYR